MLKVVFCVDGQNVSDFEARNFADSKIRQYQCNKKDMEVRFTNEAVLDAFVLRVMENQFPMDDIEFYYNDLVMEFNEYRGLKIPDGVRNIGVRCEMVAQIVRLGVEKIKKKAEKIER